MQIPWRSLLPPPFARIAPPVQRPAGTVVLLGLIAVGGLVQWFVPRVESGRLDLVLSAGALTAAGLQTGHWWQVGTHLFVNAGPAWLTVAGVLTLALTGPPLERLAGRRHLWQIFALAGTLGGLGQVGFDALLGRDALLPVAGSASATMGVLLALACMAPQTPLLPWERTNGVWRRVKVVHGALATLAASLAAGMMPPVAGVLVGGLMGCLYVHALGLCGRGGEEREGVAGGEAAPKVGAASSASWPPGASASTEKPPAGPKNGVGSSDASTVLATPATAARHALAASRFTERERRMTAREFIAEKVDPVLEKISRQGVGSLTAEERQLLEKAREKMGQG